MFVTCTNINVKVGALSKMSNVNKVEWLRVMNKVMSLDNLSKLDSLLNELCELEQNMSSEQIKQLEQNFENELKK